MRTDAKTAVTRRFSILNHRLSERNKVWFEDAARATLRNLKRYLDENHYIPDVLRSCILVKKLFPLFHTT